MQLELETYTPNEAESITGVTQATVRNWRRAGYLPRPNGHARYTVADLLVMFSMGLMVTRGVTVESASAFATNTARGIYQSLIWHKEAFTEAVADAAKSTFQGPTPEEIERYKTTLDEAFDPPLVEKLEHNAAMADAAAHLAGITGLDHPSWLVVWADGTLEFFNDADPYESFFGNIDYRQPYVQGPVLLFCLGALAQMVLDRLPRPAIRLAKRAA